MVWAHYRTIGTISLKLTEISDNSLYFCCVSPVVISGNEICIFNMYEKVALVLSADIVKSWLRDRNVFIIKNMDLLECLREILLQKDLGIFRSLDNMDRSLENEVHLL